MVSIASSNLDQPFTSTDLLPKLVASLDEQDEALIWGGALALPSFLGQANKSKQTSQSIVLGDVEPIEEIGVIGQRYG